MTVCYNGCMRDKTLENKIPFNMSMSHLNFDSLTRVRVTKNEEQTWLTITFTSLDSVEFTIALRDAHRFCMQFKHDPQLDRATGTYRTATLDRHTIVMHESVYEELKNELRGYWM